MTDARVDLGLVTIGQTPRPDLDAAFRQEAPGARIETVGALDGLDHAALEDLAGRDGDYPLLVQLADGSTLEIDRDALVPAITAGARSLAARGAQLVVVVCAGSFPDVDCAAPVLFPGRLLPSIVKTLSQTRRIGVVTPVAGQVDAARTKWQADGFDVRVTSASPVRHDEIAAAAETMADPTLDLVLLDSWGTGRRTGTSSWFGRAGRCCWPQSLVAKVAGEMLCGRLSNRLQEPRARISHGSETE